MKDQIQAELEKLEPQIKWVTNMIKDAEEDWLAHFDRSNPNDLYLRSMFYQIGDKLDDARRLISRSTAPVSVEGTFHKRKDGRYEIGHSYFTTGETIEYLLQEPGDDDQWVCSRIEHNGHDYCIEGNPKLRLEGLWVRVKEIPLWD